MVIITISVRTAAYVRRREIEIMKLVGATDWFVRWPFILEGVIVGVLSALVASLILVIAGLGFGGGQGLALGIGWRFAVLTVLALAPLVNGVIARAEAVIQQRRGSLAA